MKEASEENEQNSEKAPITPKNILEDKDKEEKEDKEKEKENQEKDKKEEDNQTLVAKEC